MRWPTVHHSRNSLLHSRNSLVNSRNSLWGIMIRDNFFDQQEFVPFLHSRDDTHIHWLFSRRDIQIKENHLDSIHFKCNGMSRSIIKINRTLCLVRFRTWGSNTSSKHLLNVGTSIQAFFYWKYGIGQEFPEMHADSFALPIIAISNRYVLVALQQMTKITLSFAFFLPRTVETSSIGKKIV